MERAEEVLSLPQNSGVSADGVRGQTGLHALGPPGRTLPPPLLLCPSPPAQKLVLEYLLYPHFPSLLVHSLVAAGLMLTVFLKTFLYL